MQHDWLDLARGLDPARLPRHVAIIMDGNGRWAKQKHRPRIYGHRAGALAVKPIVQAAGELKISHLSVYAFSTENWSRPSSEVSALFNLFMEFLKAEVDELNRQNVVLRIIGGMDKVEPDYLAKAHKISSKTWNNTGLHLNVMFNYGGRQEIIQAISAIVRGVKSNELALEAINESTLEKYLYTAGIPDPDLVIRTSGEMRLSNFLIWQAAYAELYVTPVLWPDFSPAEFMKALLDYQERNRRFGGTGD